MKKFLVLSCTLLSTLITAAPPLAVVMEQNAKRPSNSSTDPYVVRDFNYLIGMPGFTENALKMHFKLYAGYVKNTNLFLKILRQYADEDKERTPQYREIKRRLGWEYDGMILHDLYFSNLGGKGSELRSSDPLYQQIEEDFGSYEAWKEDFLATGLLRGVGWVILYRDPIEGRLSNIWVASHANGNIAGGDPLLVMDVWEHAYLLDYGLDRMAYFKAFFENIDWNVVSKRFPHESAHENSRY